MKPITKDDISAALKDVGVHTGQTLMVHTSLSKNWICVWRGADRHPGAD